MAKWVFEPGHTAAEFRARHMMVTNVRGAFKNVQGTLDFDPENPSAASVDVTIDAQGLWSGEPDRDAHLKSADFLDVAHHPTITFVSRRLVYRDGMPVRIEGRLNLRGVDHAVDLVVEHFECARTGAATQSCQAVARSVVRRIDFGMTAFAPFLESPRALPPSAVIGPA